MSVVDLYREIPSGDENVFSVALPVPPSVNNMYHVTKRGTRKLTKQAEEFIRDAQALIRVALEDGEWELPKNHTWLYVDMVFFFPDRRRRDASNCLKILLDVLEGYTYINDYNAMPRIQSVEYDKQAPRVELRITAQKKNERRKHIKSICELKPTKC